MSQRILRLITLLWLPALLIGQESEYLLQIQSSYLMPGSTVYRPVGTYYGNFDQELSSVVLNGIALSRSPQKIRLQFAVYYRGRLINPDEVIFNGQSAKDTRNLIYHIDNPANWPAQTHLKISLFANRPPLDHWIDIPIIWDRQEPSPVSLNKTTPAMTTDLTAKGVSASTVGPGHALQVATYNQTPDEKTLASFRNFGSVYYTYDPPFYKIRIGTFKNKQDALNALLDIRHFNNGAYADAFYLYESAAKAVMKVSEPSVESPQEYDAVASSGIKGVAENNTSVTARTPFINPSGNVPLSNRPLYEEPGISIQLSLHTTPPNLAEYSYLKDIGQVYILKEENVYKLKIGPFSSKEAAQAVMPQILAAGFTNAFIKLP